MAHACSLYFFFFKQKTAYEIGLGIPAEPLFRSKVKNVLALALVVRSRCEVLKASVKALVFGMSAVNNFNCRGFGPLLEDKLCLLFKLAPSVCRITFPILASLLVRLVVLLPFQLLRLSLATPSTWTPLALSVFLHCVVALLLTLLYRFVLFMSLIVTFMVNSGLSSLRMVLMSLFSRLLTLLVILTMPLFLARLTLIPRKSLSICRSEERFSRNAETDLVCRLL